MTPLLFGITLTPEQLTLLKVKAAKGGIDPNAGTLPPEHGVELSFTVMDSVVLFTVVEKPFFVTREMIMAGIEEYISSQTTPKSVTGG